MKTMRCPLGALVSHEEDAHKIQNEAELEHSAFDTKDPQKKELRKTTRCEGIGAVAPHPTQPDTLVVKCPKHGPVLANAKIWSKEILDA